MNRLYGFVLFGVAAALGARADVTTVSGDAELPGTVDGLHVTANATLSGSGVTVGGAGILVDPGVTATFTTPVTVSEGAAVVKAKDRNNGNVTVSNGFPIEVGAGGTASFEGVVSGSAPILVHGVGATHFKAANDFTGALYVTNGAFHAWNDLSFGSVDGLTSFYVPSSMNINEPAKTASIQLHLHGIDTAEPFERLDGSGYGGAYFYGTTNYLRGPVYSSNNNYRSKAGDNKTTYLYIDNFFKQASWNIPDSKVIFVYGPQSVCSFGQLSVGGSTSVVCAPINLGETSQGGLGFKSGSGVLETFCDEAFTNGAESVGKKTGLFMREKTTVDVKGTRQTFKFVFGGSSANVITGEPGSEVVTYQVGAKSGGFVDSSRPLQYSGVFADAVSLRVDGSYRTHEAWRPFIFADGVCTSTGALVVTNGAEVCFSNASSWAGTDIRVCDTSTLRLLNGSALSAAADLRLDADATLAFPTDREVKLSVRTLTVGGVALPENEYTSASDKVRISGLGKLTVLGSGEADSGVWTGGGANDAFTTEGNWENGHVIEHAKGTASLTVAGGTAMTLNEDVSVAGVAFGPEMADFTVAADSGKSLTTMVGGLSFAGTDAEEQSVVFTAPVCLGFGQTLAIPGANRTMRFEGPIASSGDIAVMKTGSGTLDLAAENTFSGSFVARQGTILARGTGAFGAANTKVVLESTAASPLYTRFGGGVHRQDFDLNGNDGGLNGTSALLYTEAGSTNEFAGEVKLTGGLRPNFGRGSRMVFSGGLTGGQGFRTSAFSDCTFVITNKPAVLGDISMSAENNRPSHLWIHSPSNTFGSMYFIIGSGMKVHCCVRHAFCRAKNSTPIEFEYNYGAFDLGGFDQEASLGDWTSSARNERSAMGEITSETPAVLDVLESASIRANLTSIEWITPFTGCAGLRKRGEASVVLSNVVGRASTSTGLVAVAEGPLVFANTADWPNVSELSVEGGTMTIEAGALVNPNANLTISGGTLELEAGVEQKVRVFTAGGVRFSGWCGSKACTDPRVPAENKLDCISGPGVLRARGGGLLLLVR